MHFKFQPTYLYIKQHSVTGKLYFGKTIRDPIKYSGSGTYWSPHIKKHGYDRVETLWYCLFYDEDTIKEFALMCSEMWNIVKSDDWANLIPENGIDGFGLIFTEEIRKKMSIAAKKKFAIPGNKEKLSASMMNPSLEIRAKISAGGKRRFTSSEERIKSSIAASNPSIETRAKMSKSAKNRKNRVCSLHTREKISIANSIAQKNKLWYNDGFNTFRLKCDDPKILEKNLKCGRKT